MAQGRHAFLHVIVDNTRALTLYERLGFRTHAVFPIRAIRPNSS